MNARWLIVTVLAFGSACSEDPGAAERAEVSQAFENDALRHIRNISGGYAAPAALREGGDLAGYQTDQREQAIAALSDLTDRGTPAQQVSVAIALADLHAQEARRHAQAATEQWIDLSGSTGNLEAQLNLARRQQSLGQGLSESGADQTIQQASDRLAEANATRRAVRDELESLREAVTELTEEKQQYETERDRAMERAAELRGQSYDAEQQTRYDLQVEAAEFTRDADKAAMEATLLGQQIDLRRSRIAEAEARLSETEARIEALEAVVDQANARNRQRGEQARQRRADAEQTAQTLLTNLQNLAEQFSQKVADPFDAAVTHHEEAVEPLRQAESKASRDIRPIVTLQLGTRQLGHGQTLRQLTVIRRGYARLLRDLADGADGHLPNPVASAIQEMAAAAEEKTAGVKQRALTVLESATGTLESAVQSLRADGELAGIAASAQSQLTTAEAALTAVREGKTARPDGSASATSAGAVAIDRRAIAALNAGNAGPAQTIEAMADGLADGQPVVLWNALPDGHRSDLTNMLRDFGGAVDADVYDRSFDVLRKLTDVLDNKRQFILDHPMLQGNPNVDRQALRANWDKIVNLLRTLTNSPLASTDGLQSIDPGAFLRNEGRMIVTQLAEASAAASEGPSLADLARTTATVVASDGDTATVEVSSVDGTTRQQRMMRVDGRWLPEEMAADWDQQVARARQRIEAMRDQGVPNKPQIMGGLTMAEGMLDNLAAADSQQAFNQALQNIMQQVGPMVMGAMGGGMGGAPGNMGGGGNMPANRTPQ